MIHSNAIAAKKARKVLKAEQASGLLTAAGVSASLGTGAAPHSEVSAGAAEVTGVQMDTGDELYFRLDPEDFNDFDLSKDIGCILRFESAEAGAGSAIDWTAAIKGFSSAEALGDAVSSPDGSITFAAAATAGQSMPADTARKTFQTGSKGLGSDKVIILAVTLADRGSAGATDIRLLSVILDGTWKIDSADGVYETN